MEVHQLWCRCLSGLRLYCWLSKVRWTCWGVDKQWQSRIGSFVVNYTYCWMHICLQLINKPIACLPHIIHIVLVMNSTKFVNHEGTVMFSLDEQFMATMIAKSIKVTLALTSLSLITLSNMWMQKDTTDMLQQVLCSRVNYCQSDKKLLCCCFWRTIGNHESSSWNIWSKVRAPSQATLNQPRQSTWILDRRRFLGRVREWSNTISYMKRYIRTNCQVKDRDSRLNSKRKWNKKQRMEQKENNNPIG